MFSLLPIIAATALLVKDANKIIMGQEFVITTHYVNDGTLKNSPSHSGVLLGPAFESLCIRNNTYYHLP